MNKWLLLSSLLFAACTHTQPAVPVAASPAPALGPVSMADADKIQVSFSAAMLDVLRLKSGVQKYNDRKGGSIFLYFKDGKYLGKHHQGKDEVNPKAPYCAFELGSFKLPIPATAFASRVRALSISPTLNGKLSRHDGQNSLLFWALENASVIKEFSCTHAAKSDDDVSWMTFEFLHAQLKSYVSFERLP